MNKKLIALAVAGACVAPTVMAQTANPVTLYGRIYVTVESVEADGGTRHAGSGAASRMSDHASLPGRARHGRPGWRPQGLLPARDGVSTPSPRPARSPTATAASACKVAGAASSLGRWDTPMKMSQTAVDPWGDLTLGDITGADARPGQLQPSRRQLDPVLVAELGGLHVRALCYAPNEGKTATLNPNGPSARIARLHQGPALRRLRVREAQGRRQRPTHPDKEEATRSPPASPSAASSSRGQYGEYSRGRPPDEDESYMIGLDLDVRAASTSCSARTRTPSNGSASTDCDMYSVGYQYDFSKRTFFVASYTEVDNSAGMNCNFGTERARAPPARTSKGFWRRPPSPVLISIGRRFRQHREGAAKAAPFFFLAQLSQESSPCSPPSIASSSPRTTRCGRCRARPSPRGRRPGEKRAEPSGRRSRRHVAGLMRVDHAGEVCAQALYAGQSLMARDERVRDALEHAGAEERDHLAWCARAPARTRFAPQPPFALLVRGLVRAGRGLRRWPATAGAWASSSRPSGRSRSTSTATSTGCPPDDARSRAILEQMREDEIGHANTGSSLGAAELPLPVKGAMRLMAKVMTETAYRF